MGFIKIHNIKISIKSLSVMLILGTILACQNEELPSVSKAETLKETIKGVWLPEELTMNYTIGVSPNQRDTTVVLTPTTNPLLVTNRPNPIMPFTDTLYIGTVAKPDTFYLRNRGVRQQGLFFVTFNNEENIQQLRIGRPTFTRGIITRWNYDIAIHGLVTRAANGSATYAGASYTNTIWGIENLTDKSLILSVQTPSNVNNLPIVPITETNQNNASVWTGRSVVLKAKFRKI